MFHVIKVSTLVNNSVKGSLLKTENENVKISGLMMYLYNDGFSLPKVKFF